MATDGPTPPPCDQEVFKKGKVVLVTHSIPSCAMEAWVQKVASKSGQKVDWYFCGGRAVVVALGSIPKVLKALNALRPEHDKLYRKATGFLPGTKKYFPIPWNIREDE